MLITNSSSQACTIKPVVRLDYPLYLHQKGMPVTGGPREANPAMPANGTCPEPAKNFSRLMDIGQYISGYIRSVATGMFSGAKWSKCVGSRVFTTDPAGELTALHRLPSWTKGAGGTEERRREEEEEKWRGEEG